MRYKELIQRLIDSQKTGVNLDTLAQLYRAWLRLKNNVEPHNWPAAEDKLKALGDCPLVHLVIEVSDQGIVDVLSLSGAGADDLQYRHAVIPCDRNPDFLQDCWGWGDQTTVTGWEETTAFLDEKTTVQRLFESNNPVVVSMPPEIWERWLGFEPSTSDPVYLK